MSIPSRLTLLFARLFRLRAWFARMVAAPPRGGRALMPPRRDRPRRDGLALSVEQVAGRSLLRARREGRPASAALLWLHGGAYAIEANRGHRALAEKAAASGLDVFLYDYPLAPEACVGETTAAVAVAWERVAAEGLPAAIAGDSAGGGLALAVAMAARDRGGPKPAALALFSPWVDLSPGAPREEELSRRDPLLSEETLAAAARLYARGTPLDDPRLSPLRGELAGLPPAIVFASRAEILSPQARALVARLSEAGSSAELLEYDGLLHDWIVFPSPETDDALERAFAFILARARSAVDAEGGRTPA